MRMGDVSSRGVGLLDTRPLEKGGQFVLHLTTGARQVDLLCEVRNCREVRPKVFWIGAEILCQAGQPQAAEDAGERERIRKAMMG